MPAKLDAIGFAFGWEELRDAYRAVQDGLSLRLLSAEQIVRNHWQLAPDAPLDQTSNDESPSAYDEFWMQVGEVQAQIEPSQRLVREAFVIALFHFWERQANGWLGVSRYDEEAVFALLTELGRNPDKAALNLLKNLANCLKHGSSDKPGGACNLLMESHPDLLDEVDGFPTADNLRINDALVACLFKAVLRSGPTAAPHWHLPT